MSTRPIPLRPNRRRITAAEWKAEGAERYGMPARKWQFRCPSCGTVQSGEDLFALGLDTDGVLRIIGFSCIGRVAGYGKGCDWTLGGLFQIHELEVVDEDGTVHPRFEFAHSAQLESEAS